MRADFNLMKRFAEVTKPKTFERINQAKDSIERVKADEQDGHNLAEISYHKVIFFSKFVSDDQFKIYNLNY